jgi:hypothetical protein
MKKLSKIVYTAFVFSLLLVGCGTIRETTTTTTEAVKIPPVIIHDTIPIPIELPITDEVTDSIGRSYLEKYCKGNVDVDRDGLKLQVSFWVNTTKALKDSLNSQKKTVLQLGYEIEKKEQEIQETKKVVETKKTPGDWWIFFASMKFWIPAIFLGLIIGVIGIILLRLKTTLLSKVLP